MSIVKKSLDLLLAGSFVVCMSKSIEYSNLAIENGKNYASQYAWEHARNISSPRLELYKQRRNRGYAISGLYFAAALSSLVLTYKLHQEDDSKKTK